MKTVKILGKGISGWIAIFISVALSVALLVTGVIKALPVEAVAEPVDEATAASEQPAMEEPSEVATEISGAESNWHFYNLDLQDNENDGDDFNFGPNPISEVAMNTGMLEQIESGNFDIAKIDPTGFDQNLRDRMRVDPALGAADMAWFDSLLGTRYLGVFYDECDEQWDAAMNKAKEQWIGDAADYNDTITAFFEYLDKADKVEVRKDDKQLSDQMYMNPATKDDVPDIIVLETDEHGGWYLVYTFTIKETKKVEVMYRIACGYQPTDVAEVMNITPTNKTSGGGTTGGGTARKGGGVVSTIKGGGTTPNPNPNPRPDPKPKPDPDDPKPEPKPTPDDPKPKPDNPDDPKPKPDNPDDPKPKPEEKKNPSKGTPVLPNDDDGPGENTNNPDNPDVSIKDKPTNSDHMTKDEYDDSIQENKDANDNSHDIGDFTPSTTVKTDDGSDVHQDNNGDEADNPSDVSDSSVADDDAGDSWDGPPD